MEPGLVVLVIAIGYVIGSFPTAYLVARTRGVDIFAVGSGNMGATNVSRAIGMRYGLLVWAIDGAKGILAILLARLIVPDYQTTASVLAAVSAVAGHNWSLLATLLTGSIRGGKGAATAMGTFVLLAPTLLVALVLAVAMAIVLLTRYVSLGVLTAVAVAGIAFLALVIAGWMDPVYTVYLLAGWMVFVRHRGNIVRLLAGTERRLGERA
ncbi:MAG: glycerol-3-phosphate acyltransferase [Anaerolineae bacterium]|nr:glycerol-3-phosphate acyltransferase [Anaerolineae bacterium]